MADLVCSDFPHLAFFCCEGCHVDDERDFSRLVEFEAPPFVTDRPIARVCCAVLGHLDAMGEKELKTAWEFAKLRERLRGRERTAITLAAGGSE